MVRLLKILSLALAGIVLLIVLSAIALKLFFDPNDFRDDIAAAVKEETGRELVIEGDLSVSLFPWLAVEVGRTRLGNAEGFGDEPFASFDSARLSVRLLPLIFRREIAVGTAALESLRVDLVTNAAGRSNWDDLVAAGEEPEPPAADADAAPRKLDVAGVAITDAAFRLRDLAAGSDYRADNVSLRTGRIALGEPFDVNGEFDFALQPNDVSGRLAIAGTIELADDFGSVAIDRPRLSGTVAGIATRPAEFSLRAPRLVADLDGSRLEPAELTLTALGVEAKAELRALSWARDLTAETGLRVASFSPREVLPLLDVELPPTADPQALSSLALSADAELGADSLMLEKLALTLDDTTMRGELRLPLSGDAPLTFELAADTLNADRYMAPAADAGEDAAAASSDDFEIPIELIRSINARGNLSVDNAIFAGMRFTKVRLGLTSRGGKLRLNPLSAELFEGSYSGDVSIDAAGDTPALSLNERVSAVKLTPLARAMFERENISGTINGSFVLNARGKTLSAMRSKLNGNMSFELADGAWEGVDFWHQLRTARALYRREPPPERRGPPRTEFSSVTATGTVTDGVFRNEDLVAALPFMQVTGSGTVDLVAGEVDYGLRARVLERPTFKGASEEELAQFTEAMIPVRVRGPLADPSVRPDIEALFREEVDRAIEKKGGELKKRLLDRLVPGAAEPPAEGEQPAEGEGEEQQEAAEEEQDLEQQLKDRLKKKLFEQ